MDNYFESEMQLLNEGASEFAKTNPDYAHALNLDSLHDRDPHVERLLEGMAFLSGKIREQLDNDLSCISEVLLEQLSPDLLKPSPSRAVMHCMDRDGELVKVKTTLAISASFVSSPVGDEATRCTFKSLEPCEILPLSIERAAINNLPEGGCRLNLDLKFNAGVVDKTLERLRFYIDAELAMVYAIIELLFSSTKQVKIKMGSVMTELKSNALRLPFFEKNDDTVEDSYGFQLLKDYFTFKEGFFFFDLNELEHIDFSSAQSFSIQVTSSQAFQLSQSPNKENFKLGCTPAINLFEKDLEALSIDGKKTQYLLNIDIKHAESHSLYGINSIESTFSQENNLCYQPFSSYASADNETLYYRIQRKTSKSSLLYLCLSGQYADCKQLLSIKAYVCNADYPRKHINLHDLQLEPGQTSQQLQGHNITRPTLYHPAVGNDKYYWQLISKFSLNYSSLANLAQLQALLNTLDTQGKSSRKISGLSNIVVTSINKVSRGAMQRGIKLSLRLDDTCFHSEGDAYLFANVLHHFFARYITVNTFIETEVEFEKSSRIFSWQAIHGNKTFF